ASALSNSITSPPPAVRSIRMMNRSPVAGVLSAPPVATWRSSRAASMRWRGEVVVSFKILPSTSGAWTNSHCAFSLAATPSRTRRVFSVSTARTNVVLQGDTTWHLTGDSNVTNLTNNASTIDFAPPIGGAFKTLTTMNYVGVGGTIGLNTFL